MVKQMTKPKTRISAGVLVFSENGHIPAASPAIKQLRHLKAQFGTMAAISAELKNASGHTFNRGYLSLVMNGKRPPSKELLIALGLRKPPKVLSEAEKELRRETRQTTNALWILHTTAHAGYTVSFTRADFCNWWIVEFRHPSYEIISVSDSSFVDAVQRANSIRFARLGQNDKTN